MYLVTSVVIFGYHCNGIYVEIMDFCIKKEKNEKLKTTK